MSKTNVTLKNVDLSLIDYNNRARTDLSGLDELINSIRESGLIHPIALLDKSKITDWSDIDAYHKESQEDKPYLLLAGGRRFHAHIKLGRESIPARIYDEALNAWEIKNIELMENLQRVGLSWTEEVALKKELHELHVSIHGKATTGKQEKQGHTIEDTAEILKESKANTSLDVGLAKALELMPELSEAKNKTEARKMMKKLKADLDTKKRATKIESKKATSNEEKDKKALSDSFILKDCIEGMKQLPDKTFDVVEIDPPYAIDLDTVKKTSIEKMEAYNEIKNSDYIEFMTEVFELSYKKLKDNGWLLCWFGPDPWFQPLLEALREAGFTVRGIPAMWVKGRGQTNQPSMYLGNAYEMMFYARKGKAVIKKQGTPNTFSYAPVNHTRKVHPTERPIELIQEILSVFTHETSKVLVPFAGSGNTLLAANNLHCQAIGYDISEPYRNSFVDRVHSGTINSYKSYNRDEEEVPMYMQEELDDDSDMPF